MKFSLCLLGCLFSLSLLAQETRTTADGRRISVNPDGTWAYVDTTPTTPATEDPRALILRLTEAARVEADRLEGEYRSAVRARSLAEADYTTAKTDPTGTRTAQENAKADFERAEGLEKATLERFERGRKTLAEYEKVRTYSDKKLVKYLRKAGYEVGETDASERTELAEAGPSTDDDKAAKKRRKELAKVNKREAKAAEKAQKREAKRLAKRAKQDDDAGVAVTDTEDAKAAEKARKRETKRLAKQARERADGAPETVNVIEPPGPPVTVVPAIRTTRPEDYARYRPEDDVLLNPPANDCEITFDGQDQFSGKYRKETAPRLLFAYTPPQLRAYITDRDYVTAYGSIIRIGGGLQILVLELYVAAQNADKAFGNIPRNAQLNIKTLDGDNVVLLNNKLARGRWDAKEGHTYYRGQYILDKQYEQQLVNSEVDQLRMVWETGYDDIPIYELDFFQHQFACLNADQ